MNSTSIPAKLGATTATLATPAMLFLGAGTAQAAQAIGVWTLSAPGGVEVDVMSVGENGKPAPSGWCTCTSTVQGDPFGKPAPALGVPFYLAPSSPSAKTNPMDGIGLSDVLSGNASRSMSKAWTPNAI